MMMRGVEKQERIVCWAPVAGTTGERSVCVCLFSCMHLLSLSQLAIAQPPRPLKFPQLGCLPSSHLPRFASRACSCISVSACSALPFLTSTSVSDVTCYGPYDYCEAPPSSRLCIFSLRHYSLVACTVGVPLFCFAFCLLVSRQGCFYLQFALSLRRC